MLRREGIARESVNDAEVVRHLVDRTLHSLAGRELDLLVNEACFKEEKRLARSKDSRDQAYLGLLRDARRRLAWASDAELKSITGELVAHYAREIHGHFDSRTYARATRILPKGLALLLRNQKPWQLLTQGSGSPMLADSIRTTGEIAAFDKLVELGTVVLVPTHLSNLDSPVIGFALHACGLPPMIYGAGLNLFTNWLLSHYMDHLGAYKVDRLKGFDLYKAVLKNYSAMAIERRWHSLFFPGGTRSRSGEVEVKLKKGLMGTGLDAYQANLRNGGERSRVFFVPATLNYHLVLEAETLIDDHLQEAGKARYIITDDEFSRPGRVLDFVRSMLSMDNPIEVRFGTPLDPFGNDVDEAGNSLDPHGRPFDPAGYVMRDGGVVDDAQRDREYTNRLAERIGQRFLRDNVIFDTHVLAAALHRRLQAHHPDLDVYRRLLLGTEARRFGVVEVDAEIRNIVDALRKLAERGEVQLGDALQTGLPQELRQSALRHFGRYHSGRAAAGREGSVLMEDPRLALYYANRLQHYPLPPPLPTEGTR